MSSVTLLASILISDIPVHGGWSQWSRWWSPWSKSCGRGTSTNLVPILHRQITDEVVSDLANGQGIVKEFVAQVKIIPLAKIKQDIDMGILGIGSCKTVAIKFRSTEKCAFNLSQTRKISTC